MAYKAALFVVLAIMAGGVAMLVWSKPVAGPRSGIDSVRFDTAGWDRIDISFSSMMWKRADGDVLEMKLVPEFSSVMVNGDLEAMRAESRRLVSSKGGSLVSADLVTVAGRTAGALIYKSEDSPGADYIGMLFIRNEADRFIFSVVSRARETAGVQGDVPPAQLESRVRATLGVLQRTIAFQ